MKTAISVPDEAYQRIEQAAHQAGLNRSEFYTKAALRLADELDDQLITDAINAALERDGEDDTNALAAAHGRRRLADEQW